MIGYLAGVSGLYFASTESNVKYDALCELYLSFFFLSFFSVSEERRGEGVFVMLKKEIVYFWFENERRMFW